MKTIKINNIDYIPLSNYKELEKKKVKIVEVPKEVMKEIKVTESIDIGDNMILDSCKILGMFCLPKEYMDCEVIEIKGLEYNRLSNPKILFKGDKFNSKKIEVCYVNDSYYSKEYIDKIKGIVNIIYDLTEDKEEPKLYMSYNKDKGYIKDNPLLIKFGERLCFLLAPRIESQDE